MAEYYPLISRAVAGLRTAKPEARQAIYDRARQALIGQLRAMDPPVPEEAIGRETLALDEAIARTESEVGGPGESTAPAAGENEAAPPATPDVKPKRPPPPPPEISSKSPPKPSTAAPALGGAKRDEPQRVDPLLNPRPRSPEPLLRPATARPTTVSPEPAAARSPAAATSTAGEMPIPPPIVSPQRVEPAAPGFPAAAALKVEPAGNAESATLKTAESEDPSDEADAALAEARGGRSRDDTARPAAPRPAEHRRTNLRVWIVAIAALAAVVVIAFTAWRLRDNPQQLARLPAPAQKVAAAPDKIVERADNSESAATTTTAPAPVGSDEASRVTKETAPAPGSSAPPATAVPTGADTGSTSQATGTAQVAAQAPPGNQTQSDPTLPIAYKAAILVDAPDLPEKVKTYVGTVVWSSQNVPLGQGQPLGRAIQADVSIPEANAQLMMQIRRNTESQLPASHTIDLKFMLGSGSALGSIKQVNVPQMRQQDMPTGDPLAGIPVTIADNYFLIGLLRGAAEDRNLDLLRSRGWFDIPLLLANGKASKITFEKGASGDKIFDDVLNSWKNAQN